MNPRVKNVFPKENYVIHLVFANGEEKLYDVKPLLNTGVFKQLKDMKKFNTVEPFYGSIRWEDDQDICPDVLYEDSVPYLKPVEEK